MLIVKRGEIYKAHLSEGIDSEQQKDRLVVIVQNNIGNICSPNVICCCLTSSTNKPNLPVHLEAIVDGKKAVFLCEQLFTLSKNRLIDKVAEISSETREALDRCLAISLGLVS